MKFNLSKNVPADEQKVEWVSWNKTLKDDGSFTIQLDRISFKEDPTPVFYVIDETNNVGTSVFCSNHPDSKFQDAIPHGMRLANAIGRHFNLEAEVDVQDLISAVNDAEGLSVQVEKTDKGVLWSIV